MTNKRLFFPDDLDRINKKYFSDLRQKNDISADPSYWYENYSTAALKFGFENIKNYKSDYHNGLKNEKPTILSTLSSWDQTTYSYDDVTICASATSASNILLAYLKHEMGISDIYFETPCYFASLKQAQFLNFQVTKLPTYFDNDFKADFSGLSNQNPKIIWLTQPRFGLGSNYGKNELDKILSYLGYKDFIVIDEATEQNFPSHLAEYNFQNDERIIKIRSPFKGLGINGPRISTIIHGPKHRQILQNTLEQVQGAIDVFSLGFAHEIMSDEIRYSSMLAAANKQIHELHKKLRVWSLGTSITPSNMQNGYIGSVSLEYDESTLGYPRKREKLLAHCALHKMPIILGANLNFAQDEKREFIRFNYFNQPEDLRKAIEILGVFRLT